MRTNAITITIIITIIKERYKYSNFAISCCRFKCIKVLRMNMQGTHKKPNTHTHTPTHNVRHNEVPDALETRSIEWGIEGWRGK